MPRPLRVLVDRLALIFAALMLVVAIMLALSGRPGASTLLSSLLLLVLGYALLRTSLGLREPVLQLLGWLGALAAAGFIVISQAWVWGLFGQSSQDGYARWFLPSCALAAFAAFTADVALLHRIVLHGMYARIVRGAAIAAMGMHIRNTGWYRTRVNYTNCLDCHCVAWNIFAAPNFFSVSKETTGPKTTIA